MSPKDGRARGASRELQTTRIYLYLHKHIVDSTIWRADKMRENSLFAIKIYSASLFAIEKVFFPNLPLR